MIIGPREIELANRLRLEVQAETDSVGEAEGVSMLLLYSFLMDHARTLELDVEQLAREELEGFIKALRGRLETSKTQ